jgi:signal transduction histidine kinase
MDYNQVQAPVTEIILNVDDYAPGRYARTKVLQRAGFTVYEATTGKEALRLAAEEKPALILLDVNLPDMSGFEVCKRLRKDPETLSASVVHISATNVEIQQQVEGLEGGADIYLVEPIEPVLLIATVKALLRARMAEEALRRSNEELARFGYRVAHDLSEPLRTLAAHTQLIQMKLGGHVDGDVSESLQFVVEAATRMRSFIDGLLSYAQAAYEPKDMKRIDCEAMLTRLIANLKSTIHSNAVVITHDPLPEIVADGSIELVFQNLITNAIKYSREGVAPEIHVSARPDESSWIFSVRDNGIGIESGHREQIFTMFQRLHGRDIPGIGMGLALAKKIVETHGGTIWVESEPGVGSTFFFRLPRASET